MRATARMRWQNNLRASVFSETVYRSWTILEYIPVVLALRRQPGDHKFKASPGYIVRSCLN